MLAPLVLDPVVPWTIQLDQQVALRVAAPGRTRSLYPLRRLARVVCGRHARWETDALLACLEAGVPVVFTDQRGESLAWCFGSRRREATLEELLRLALSHHEWEDRFGVWREAVMRREILACLRALKLPARPLPVDKARVAICNWHRDRLGFPVRPYIRALEQAAAGVVAQGLHAMIGDAALLAFRREGLHLPQIMTGLVQWRLHRLLARSPLTDLVVPPGHAGATHLRRWALRVTEGTGAPVHRALGELMGDLEHSLREWVL